MLCIRGIAVKQGLAIKLLSLIKWKDIHEQIIHQKETR